MLSTHLVTAIGDVVSNVRSFIHVLIEMKDEHEKHTSRTRTEVSTKGILFNTLRSVNSLQEHLHRLMGMHEKKRAHLDDDVIITERCCGNRLLVGVLSVDDTEEGE